MALFSPRALDDKKNSLKFILQVYNTTRIFTKAKRRYNLSAT